MAIFRNRFLNLSLIALSCGLVMAGCSASVSVGSTSSTPAITNVVISDQQDSKAPKDTFNRETPKVFAFFELEGMSGGEQVKSVWICEKSDVAPPNYKIEEKTLTVAAGNNSGNFSLSKPTKGWPIGQYHVDLYINDALKDTEKFTVK